MRLSAHVITISDREGRSESLQIYFKFSGVGLRVFVRESKQGIRKVAILWQ